ncbi:restriction endonuclease subunit S [Bradyrhizobium sp. CCBAU 21365]|uniref:restriction endonuclease subunit S n=1 Tax=Bradyrhizobium sp. CCBAU 21365 TaxID=1325083 RepID=UPI00188C2EFB|nr:restriction endonuclease subunit S [Bradyrhizobium sp. CCBAU 21365]
MLAELPKGWRAGRLKDLCESIERRLGTNAKLDILSVTKRGVIPQSETYDKEIASEDISKYRVIKPGEFGLAPMALYYGAIGRYRGEKPAIISPAYNVFKHRSETDPRYLEALIRLPRMIARYEALSQGGNLEGKRKSTPYDAFETIKVLVPPLPEQRAISEMLGSLEDVIAKTESLIERIAQAKRAAMRELLTLGIRRAKAPVKRMSTHWVLGRIAEGVTHIPVDWELVTLIKVAKLESGHTPDRKQPTYWDGSIPWISLQDADALGRLTISETAETIGPEGLANSSARMLPAGTVVLQRTANVGLASIMSREMCTSQHFANWICGPTLCPQYLQQVFRHMSREWLRLMAGSVLPDIYMDTFKALQILVPPLQEQKKIGEVGAAFDRRIEHERDTLELFVQYRAALAQELLSGRLRLPDSVIARHRDKPEKAA